MKTKSFFCLAFFILMMAGCHTDNTAEQQVISVPFEHAEVIDMGQFIENIRYIQLQNHPESAFTNIDKMLVFGGNMFMLDKRLEAVFCFDTTGKFRYRIQRVGRGPGEYQELESFWLKPAEKELWLSSFWPSKIMVYNFDGVMLREFKTRWSGNDMVRVGDNTIAVYNTSGCNDGYDSLREGMFLLGEDGGCRGQAKILGDSSMYWSMAMHRCLEETENGALLLSQSDTIFKIDSKGAVTPDIFLDWGSLKFPDDLRRIYFGTPGSEEVFKGNYVTGKDQLVAFGPIRMFEIFIDGHLEFALANLKTRRGSFSTQITCKTASVPLLNPFSKSDRDELIGMYDMSLLIAMKESQSNRKEDEKMNKFFRAMDSLVGSALAQDRPVLWIAKIKQEWLNTTH
ncbi:MAG: 6-bladed beta-propeller [Bacteroidales bacterium]|jgi:hypothetical protein